ncbi:uncharacterized protein LOC131946830 [Physella acuta]|uniref:uncharacterized protein LOC131946830 n=1 Tax=Physella acuta TaxID=109671 RepID=UPI0027DD2DA6|nr:uncharacterized protein LOC131946830 [Physella acuta]
MVLVRVLLTFLGCWSVAAQDPSREIVHPSVVNAGGDYTVSCNSDLAGVPGKGQNLGLIAMCIGWTNGIDEMECFARYRAIDRSIYIRKESNTAPSSMRLWNSKVKGPEKYDYRGVPDRDSVNITMTATKVKRQESGIFCCNASYQDLNDDTRFISRCQTITVVGAGAVLTLDEYCSTKLPEGNRASFRTLSIQETLRFCGNADVYTDCLLSARTSSDTTYTVKLFEKHFPSEYDLKRAAYVYCTIGVQELYRFILNDVNNFIDCERNANTGQCEIEANSEAGLKDLTAAVASNNEADIKKHSCKLSLDYMKCIQAQYTKWNQTSNMFPVSVPQTVTRLHEVLSLDYMKCIQAQYTKWNQTSNMFPVSVPQTVTRLHEVLLSLDYMKCIQAQYTKWNQTSNMFPVSVPQTVTRLHEVLSLDYMKCIQAQYTKCNQTSNMFPVSVPQTVTRLHEVYPSPVHQM